MARHLAGLALLVPMFVRNFSGQDGYHVVPVWHIRAVHFDFGWLEWIARTPCKHSYVVPTRYPEISPSLTWDRERRVLGRCCFTGKGCTESLITFKWQATKTMTLLLASYCICLFYLFVFVYPRRTAFICSLPPWLCISFQGPFGSLLLLFTNFMIK